MATMRAMYWVDANGKTRLTTLRANATLAAIMLALQAKSNASVFQDFEGALITATAFTISAPYPSVQDAARLTYTDGSGSLVTVVLPAPVSSIFLADQYTVDTTQIATINAAIIGTVLTPAGGVVSAFVSGTRAPTGRTL